MKKVILFFATSLVTGWIYGQGEMDAFRLSGRDLSGTARGVAMGGAFGALGGNITGIAQNPAGIGIYRSAELVTTLDFASVNTETNTFGTIGKDRKFNFSSDNFAWVGRSADNNFFNIGIVYNRIKSYGRNYQTKGNQLTSSLTDYIANFTTRENIDPKDLSDYWDWGDERQYNKLPWISILGYDAGLIEPNGLDSNRRNKYISPLTKSETVDRTYSVSERGYIDTYDFIMGGNASKDKVYWGLTLSITSMRYKLNSYYSEEFGSRGGFSWDNYLKTKGTGFQTSAGIIYRPIDELRIGIAYHSPTWYNLVEDYYAQANCDYFINKGHIKLQAETPDGYTDYSFRTPDRWVVSAAGVLGGRAIVSLDYEYSNYSKMKLKYDFFYREQNSYISEDFKGASTIKAGLEFRATPQISLRAGYAWMQSPLEKSFKAGEIEVLPIKTMTAYTLDGDTRYYSCGVGYRFTSNLYMDVAFAYKTQTNQLYTYSPIYDEGLEVIPIPSKLKNDTYKFLLTLGYKFKLWQY